MDNLLGLLLAGGVGKRLKHLTRSLPKPLVPYAGTCRMIDFSLNNCSRSGIREVLLLSKHEEKQIHRYLLGQWSQQLKLNFGCYQAIHNRPLEEVYSRVSRQEESGTADALIKNREYIDRADVEDVLILHSDHIYYFDYRDMYARHRSSGAVLTIGYQKIPKRFVSLFGMVSFDGEDNLTAFVEKPANPESDTVFTAVCIFNKPVMYRYLEQLQGSDWQFDISHDLIPAMLANGERIKGYKFNDYWEDIGTTQRYYQSHLRLAQKTISLAAPLTLPGAEGIRIYKDDQFQQVAMPQSMRCEGFTAVNSFIFPGVRVAPGSHIENSVLLPGYRLDQAAEVENILGSEQGVETIVPGVEVCAA